MFSCIQVVRLLCMTQQVWSIVPITQKGMVRTYVQQSVANLFD